MPKRYRYFLSIQTTLPETFPDDSRFEAHLGLLDQLGFDGVELNIRDPESVRPDVLSAALRRSNLSFSMLATGLSASVFGMSLASTDNDMRRESVKRTNRWFPTARELGGGIIVGLLKGRAGETSRDHLEQLRRSVAELAETAEKTKVPLLVEAVNRFESPLGHTLAEISRILPASGNPYVHILPDTWHMNIEESNMEAALVRYRDHYCSIHLSDNNRFLPGMGCLDFKRIIGVLDALNYNGKLAIEGNFAGSFEDDVASTMRYLGPILSVN